MNRRATVLHEFVQFVPVELKQCTVYVSIEYATAVHLCLCGCGNKVVTPITPTDWKLTFDGETISLAPSIGNWSFKCRSHYWIERNRVEWARDWSETQVALGRQQDQREKRRYFDREERADHVRAEPRSQEQQGFIGRLKKLFWP